MFPPTCSVPISITLTMSFCNVNSYKQPHCFQLEFLQYSQNQYPSETPAAVEQNLLRSLGFCFSDINFFPFVPAVLTGTVASCGGCYLILGPIEQFFILSSVKITYGFCLLTHLTDRALEDNPVKGPYFSDKHQPEKGQMRSKVKT